VASYSAGVSAAGMRHRKVLYGETKQEVLAKLRAVQNRGDLGMLPADAKDVTVMQWLSRWLANTRATVAANTFLKYEQIVRRFLAPRVGAIKLHQLRPDDVAALYTGMLSDGIGPAMTRKTGIVLGVSLNAAVAANRVAFNPASRVKKPKAPRKEPVVLEPEQAAALVRAADGERLGAFVVFQLDSGCRPGEAMGLNWKDVDFKTGAVSITKSLEDVAGVTRLKDVKTKSGRRRLFLSAPTLAALADHRKRMLKEGWNVTAGPVFVSTTGTHLSLSNVRRSALRPVLAKAGLPKTTTLYSLRHTSASLALAAGVNVKVLSERLGHTSTAFTMDVYVKSISGQQEQAAVAVGKLIHAAGSN
jgi:integrase